MKIYKTNTIVYSSLFITAIMSLPRLSAIHNNALWAKLAPFNFYEWIFQTIIVFLFCFLSFLLNNTTKLLLKNWRIQLRQFTLNFLLYLLCLLIGISINYYLLYKETNLLTGYLFRLLFVGLLVYIEIKILKSIYVSQQKEKENEFLLRENIKLELSLLKSQLNPHFLFNILSSLSGIVRENPELSQHYITQLSKFFRYSINHKKQELVTLKDEINLIYSYGELMKMRFENGFQIIIGIDKLYYNVLIPQMTLQPLVENALKHNIVDPLSPLKLKLFVLNNYVVISNNLQPLNLPNKGTGVGLANLSKRFLLLTKNDIEIEQTEIEFIVKLPIL